jgi:hypothetical protein
VARWPPGYTRDEEDERGLGMYVGIGTLLLVLLIVLLIVYVF